MHIPAWDKQALYQSVRVVRSNPFTVRRVFDKHASKHDQGTERPPCTCSAISPNTPGFTLIDGHAALIPVPVFYPDGTPARPNDSLALPGRVSRTHAVKAVRRVCEQLNVSLPDFTSALPDVLWGETGSNLQYFEAQADHLCSSLYIRIVDKGVGMLWVFVGIGHGREHMNS